MEKYEIFVGGTHYVSIPGIGLFCSKIVERIGKYFICNEDSSIGLFYVISSSGKIMIFPVKKDDVIDVEQHFSDGIFFLKDNTPDTSKMIFFKSYQVKDNVFTLIDAIHKQEIAVPIK